MRWGIKSESIYRVHGHPPAAAALASDWTRALPLVTSALRRHTPLRCQNLHLTVHLASHATAQHMEGEALTQEVQNPTQSLTAFEVKVGRR